MTETAVPAAHVPKYLKAQEIAMLGLHTNHSGKHAVVYTGTQNGKLVFLNNKWANTDAPEQLLFTETELTAQIPATAMIATLKPIPPKPAAWTEILLRSERVIWQNLEEVQSLSSHRKTVGALRGTLDTLFRPLLLDGITMLTLLGEHELAQRFTAVQRQFLKVLNRDPQDTVKLEDFLPMAALSASVHDYIRLIRSAPL